MIDNHVMAFLRPDRFNRVLDHFPVLVDLPEMQVGDWTVAHLSVPAGKPIPTFDRGLVRFSEDVVIRQLRHKGKLWMSDSPSEREDMAEMAQAANGPHVLVAGLGMGLVAAMLADRPDIERVTVVEIASEVIEIIRPHLSSRKIEVVRADFRQWIKEANTDCYSFVILDIWGHISLEDIRDMVGLWAATKIRWGKIWGLENLLYRLIDDCRRSGCFSLSDLSQKLSDYGCDQVAEYIAAQSEEDWETECQCDLDYEGCECEFECDTLIFEAFTAVYHLDIRY